MGQGFFNGRVGIIIIIIFFLLLFFSSGAAMKIIKKWNGLFILCVDKP